MYFLALLTSGRICTEPRWETVILKYELVSARAAVAAHNLDVLFYPDIGLDVLTYFGIRTLGSCAGDDWGIQ